MNSWGIIKVVNKITRKSSDAIVMINGSINENWDNAFDFLYDDRKDLLRRIFAIVAAFSVCLLLGVLADMMQSTAISFLAILLLAVSFAFGFGSLLSTTETMREQSAIIANKLVQNEISDIRIATDSDSVECLVATSAASFLICQRSDDHRDSVVKPLDIKTHAIKETEDGFVIENKATCAVTAFTVSKEQKKLNLSFKKHYASITYFKDRSFVTPYTLFKKR